MGNHKSKSSPKHIRLVSIPSEHEPPVDEASKPEPLPLATIPSKPEPPVDEATKPEPLPLATIPSKPEPPVDDVSKPEPLPLATIPSKPEPPVDEATKPEPLPLATIPSKPEPTCTTPEPSKPEQKAFANWNFTQSKDAATSFATLSFAKGTSRRAYRAMYWTPDHKYGMKAVIKEYKDQYQWAQSDWDTAVSLYDQANKLAKAFNRIKKKGPQVHIVDYSIHKVTTTPDNTKRPKLNEYVLVEDYLEGEFEKYISNTGHVNQACCMNYVVMPAFTHWSWVHTRGDLMITDLQGVRYDDKYVLTDPCVLSIDKRFGAMDNSAIGMAMFFSSHVCNSVCQALKIKTIRPDTEPIEEHMMASTIKMQKSTSYISADDYAKIPNKVKLKIKQALQDAFEKETHVKAS